MIVATYLRCSTEEQQRGGYSLEAQSDATRAEIERRGWTLSHEAREVSSAKDMRRPVLRALLDQLDEQFYGGLIVGRLDRLSRSVRDFADIVQRSQKKGWTLVCLNPDVDLTTAEGRAMAGMISVFAEFERSLISQRTREGLKAAKVRGVLLGRPPETDPETERLIMEYRERGLSFRKIATMLDLEGVPTPRGGESWDQRSIGGIVHRLEGVGTPSQL